MTYAAAVSANRNPADTMFGRLSLSEIELAEIKAREALYKSNRDNYPARQARLVRLVKETASASRPHVQHGSAQSPSDLKPAG